MRVLLARSVVGWTLSGYGFKMRAAFIGFGVLLLAACGANTETGLFLDAAAAGSRGDSTPAAAGRVGLAALISGSAGHSTGSVSQSEGGKAGAGTGAGASGGGASGQASAGASEAGGAGLGASGAAGSAGAGGSGKAGAGGQAGASTGNGGASGASGGHGGAASVCLTQTACASPTNRAGKCGAAIAQPGGCPVVDCSAKCPIANDYCPATGPGALNVSSCEPIAGGDNQCDIPVGESCPSKAAGGKTIHVQIGALTLCCSRPPVAPACVYDADYYRWVC